MKKNILKTLLLATSVLFTLSGCSASSGDDDLYTVPVTNNPQIVPNHGSGFPMMQGG